MSGRRPPPSETGGVDLSGVRFLLVDGTDLAKPIFGSGGKAVVASCLRTLGERVAFVGTSSGDHPVGRWVLVDYAGARIPFLAVARPDDLERSIVPSTNVAFAARVAACEAALRQVPTTRVLTRTWSVLWWLVRPGSPWRVVYYAPGLGNPMRIGRRPALGRALALPYEALQGQALRRAHRVFAAASTDEIERYRAELRRLGAAVPIASAPTAVDVTFFRPSDRRAARVALALAPAAPVFAFVGRLARVKGLDLLLGALASFHRRHGPATLLLVGDGELEGELHAAVAAADLASHVRFLGRRTPAEIAGVYAAADALVMASHTEGFSNTMLEALASGRPIVSTRVSGTADVIVEGVNGFVVDARDPDLYADRMHATLTLADAERVSRELAVSRYSDQALWTTLGAAWGDLP